jgi:hypothetical protein
VDPYSVVIPLAIHCARAATKAVDLADAHPVLGSCGSAFVVALQRDECGRDGERQAGVGELTGGRLTAKRGDLNPADADDPEKVSRLVQSERMVDETDRPAFIAHGPVLNRARGERDSRDNNQQNCFTAAASRVRRDLGAPSRVENSRASFLLVRRGNLAFR